MKRGVVIIEKWYKAGRGAGRAAVLLAGLLCGVGIGGCAGDGEAAPVVRSEDPFAPTTLRVHPLTHVEMQGPGLEAGKCMVVLHYELHDAWGDAVKSTGMLRVELYRPGSGVTPGIETQDVAWDMPRMQEAEYNSGRYDPATRTYRVPLLAPAPVAEALKGGAGWIKLRVVFTPNRGVATVDGTSPGAGRAWLEDEFVVQR